MAGVQNNGGEFQKQCVLDFVSEEDVGQVERFASIQNMILI